MDPKSLSQNLYNTAAMIYSFSKYIPSPTSVISALRTGEWAANDVDEDIVAEPASAPLTSEKSELTNGHAVGPIVNGTRIHGMSGKLHGTSKTRRSSQDLVNIDGPRQLHHLNDSATNGHILTQKVPLLDGTP